MSFDNVRTLNCYTLRTSKDIFLAINEQMPWKRSSLFQQLLGLKIGGFRSILVLISNVQGRKYLCCCCCCCCI